jgi:cytochrome c
MLSSRLIRRPGANRIQRLAAAALLVVAGVAQAGDGADAAMLKGKQAFQICAACHSVSADGAHALGPNLRGVVGRKAGTAPGFAYSKAMKNSGLAWTKEDLDAFLASPMEKLPKNAMPYAGMKDAETRHAVIQYIETLK